MKIKSSGSVFIVFVLGLLGFTACKGKSDSSGPSTAQPGATATAQGDQAERDLRQEEIQKQIMEQQQRSLDMANQQRQIMMQQQQIQNAQQQAVQNSLQTQRQTQQSIDAANQARQAGQNR